MTVSAAPTRVVRHRSADGWWELVFGAPAPRLRRFVRGYCGFAEAAARPVRRREVPSAEVVLIVNLGATLRVEHPRGTVVAVGRGSGFVAGLHETSALTEMAGSQRGLEAKLTPVGAHLFLGLPMDAVANRVVTLDDLLGATARDVAARLEAAADWEARFAILDGVLAARVAAAAAPSAGVVWAWDRLRETGGRVAVGALAEELGWSRQRLVVRFREEIGLPPKAVGRILRFRRVLDRIERDAPVRWAEIAGDCGYYDQAHLINDFRRLSGSTPGAFLRHRLPDRGDVAAD